MYTKEQTYSKILHIKHKAMILYVKYKDEQHKELKDMLVDLLINMETEK